MEDVQGLTGSHWTSSSGEHSLLQKHLSDMLTRSVVCVIVHLQLIEIELELPNTFNYNSPELTILFFSAALDSDTRVLHRGPPRRVGVGASKRSFSPSPLDDLLEVHGGRDRLCPWGERGFAHPIGG
jgi:hypothetical protein